MPWSTPAMSEMAAAGEVSRSSPPGSWRAKGARLRLPRSCAPSCASGCPTTWCRPPS